MIQDLGFRVMVWGLGFGVWGLGFGVWGLGFGVLEVFRLVEGCQPRRGAAESPGSQGVETPKPLNP